MEHLFGSIFNDSLDTTVAFIIMVAVALVVGILDSFIISFRMRSNKRFYIANSIIPAIVSLIIALVNSNLGVGLAVAGAFGLVRFRSAQGNSEEIAAIFISSAIGLAFGTGYLAYGVIAGLGLSLAFVGFSFLPIFQHKSQDYEKLVKITVPEDLNYDEAFEEIFTHYLKEVELLKVKTSDMGSLYRLEYRAKFKNTGDLKTFIDEVRERNANLDVAVLSYQIGEKGGSL